MYDLPVKRQVENGSWHVHVDPTGNPHMRKEFEKALAVTASHAVEFRKALKKKLIK